MMQIATQGRVAVIAMLDLALRAEQGPIALATIGARQKISLTYLESLFARLRRRGLVRSTRGPGGGYGLACSAVDITVADIVYAVDESKPPGARAAPEPSSANPSAGQRIASDWCADLEREMAQFLASVSLHDLVLQQDRAGQGAADRHFAGAAQAADAPRGGESLSADRSK
ncbi:Rrf2 family transcriptional regulator [Polaromonas sp.]|uniref:Rrf2 family transcriptional regulator n=1 Tax=Polaromonas sp. TaxID=1869339 RepID=UPI00248731A9|nr:Rrf2 family transcriptional regulator [Polaromonas sp.]MDI1340598.1 Rrf2 family transcriptional regulator [Polaromonas sp.]